MTRILIAEDDRDIAELVQYNLKADGLDVIVVSDGRPALCELQKGGFGLLVLDLMLPTVSGLEVCKAVRCDPNPKQLPILIMTARGEEAIRSLAFSINGEERNSKTNWRWTQSGANSSLTGNNTGNIAPSVVPLRR